MFGFLKKKKVAFHTIAQGRILPLSEVPDKAFSTKMLGDGYAVLLESGTIASPVDGIIAQIFPTNHAFGIVTDCGLEVLVHIGIDTVELKGACFKRLIEVGTPVKAGDAVIEVDLLAVKAAGKAVITPVVITNSDKIKQITVNYDGASEIVAVVEI
jgi:glucose-specific phosphotransferase system IIA component